MKYTRVKTREVFARRRKGIDEGKEPAFRVRKGEAKLGVRESCRKQISATAPDQCAIANYYH